MTYFEPFDRKQWFETLARAAKDRALGTVDARVRAALHDVVETYSQLAAQAHGHCFCGRKATCYKTHREENVGLCHLHAVAWEGDRLRKPG